MKPIFRVLFTAIALWSFTCEEAGAEPGLDSGTLNSPCDEQETVSKRLALQTATIAGQVGTTLPPEAAQQLLDTVRGLVLNVQARLVECWSAEVAYNQSLMANKGSGGAAETSRYQSAVTQLRSIVGGLPTKSPGETELDRSLNASIGGFYGSTVQQLYRSENLLSVKGLHDRIREAYADVLKRSIDCRVQNRKDGTTACPEIGDKIDLYNFTITARILDAEPKVASLTKQMKASRSAGMSAAMTAERYRGALQNTFMAIQGTIGYIQSLQWWAGYHLNLYYYCVAWANYFAYYGNWGAYWAYIGAAQQYANGFWYLVGYAIPYYQYVVQTLMNQAQSLQNAIPALEKSAMDNMMMADRLKGLIIALPVAQLEN